MKVGVIKEIFPGECRVAATPETARRLIEKQGFEVTVETGAGDLASFPDESYRSAGCKIADTSSQIWGECDIVLKVRSPSDEEIEQLRPDTTLISFLAPAQNPDLLEKIAARGASAIAIEAVPRISRAQKLDRSEEHTSELQSQD